MNKPTIIIYFKNPKYDEKGTCTPDELTFEDGKKLGDFIHHQELLNAESTECINTLKNENSALKEQIVTALETIRMLNEAVSSLSAQLNSIKEDLRK